MILALDAGGTLIKYGFFDEAGALADTGSVPTPRAVDGATKEDFRDAVARVLARSEGRVEGIALSLPGTIDPATGHVFQGGSLSYHHGVDLVSWYEKEFGIPVTVENDARCAALAEMATGAMRGVRNGIVLTFGTGVGCALIIGGAIYRGSHLFSGEISASIFGDLAREGAGAVLGAKLGIGAFCARVCAARGVPTADGRQVFAWVAEGDAEACRLWDAYCADAAVALFNLQLTLDPERVVIGGGVSENPLFLRGIADALEAFYSRLPVAVPHLEVVRCAFCNGANLRGAYATFCRRHPEIAPA